jgi:hypothetical protein
MRNLITRLLIWLGLKKPSNPPLPGVQTQANPPPTDPPKDGGEGQ